MASQVAPQTNLVDKSRALPSQKLPVHVISPVVPIKPAVLKLDTMKPSKPAVAPKPTVRAAPKPVAHANLAPRQSRPPVPVVQSVSASRAAGLQKLISNSRPKPPTRAVFKADPAVHAMTPEAKARVQSRITAFGYKNTPSTHRMFRDRKPQAYPRLWKTEKIFYPGDNGRERRPIPGFA